MTLNSVKPLYVIINKVNGYVDEHNGNRCLELLHTNKNRAALKKYEKGWKKIEKNQQVIAQTIMIKNK